MPDRFDVIVLGLGPGGEVAADRLLKKGKRVAVVEKELIGGECAYWACIPSKTLIRPPEARSEASRVPGAGTPELNWREAAEYRDFMVRHYDDSKQIEGYRKEGATVLKGAGRLTGRGTVEVDGHRLEAEHVIIATGSDPVIPPIEGLREAKPWTNREATALKEIPSSVVVIGGGPVGIELGQMLRRFGSRVTIVEGSAHIAARETAAPAELLEAALREEGIDLRLGVAVSRVEGRAGSAAVILADGSRLEADVLIAATGRRPHTQDLGLESVGVEASPRGIRIDGRCSVQEGLWAIGDVTGVMQFTHVAKYQGRIAADNILGKRREADYKAIPRVIFSDPELAAVGLTDKQAREAGIDLAESRISLPESLARPWTYERDPGPGELGLYGDRRRGVLVGAWAVGPLAGEWIHLAALAIQAEIPIGKLVDSVAQFPTFSEAYLLGFEGLDMAGGHAARNEDAAAVAGS